MRVTCCSCRLKVSLLKQNKHTRNHCWLNPQPPQSHHYPNAPRGGTQRTHATQEGVLLEAALSFFLGRGKIKLHQRAESQLYLQISRIFRKCWITHLKFIEWVEKIERAKAHEIGSYNPRTKLMEKLLKPFYWNHSKCSKSSLEKQGMATFRSFSCNFVRSKCHLKSAHESARNWDSWNCPNSWKSGSGAVLFFSKFQRLDAVQKKMLRPKKRWEENSCWSRVAIFSCAGGKSSKKH